MIREIKTTSRDASVDENVVLSDLQQLDPLWTYVGQVGNIKLFRLERSD